LTEPTYSHGIRFRLHFERETKEEVEKRKKVAREKILQPVSEKEMEINIGDIYPADKGGAMSTLSTLIERSVLFLLKDNTGLCHEPL
jgi:hypothetical protein